MVRENKKNFVNILLHEKLNLFIYYYYSKLDKGIFFGSPKTKVQVELLISKDDAS
jgi:hypothetical protein